MTAQASETSLPRNRAPAWADLRAWRLTPIETYPPAVALVQTIPGKLTLLAVVAAFMKLHALDGWIAGPATWLILTVIAGLVSVSARYRYYVLLAGAGVLLARHPTWFDFEAVEAVLRQQYLYGTFHLSTLRAVTLIGCAPLAIL